MTPTDAGETRSEQQNRRTWQFKYLYGELPEAIQKLGSKQFVRFVEDPQHPSLRWHKLKNNSRGQHHPDSYSISISLQYRAIYFPAGDVNVWYWVGTHVDYNQFTANA